MKSICLYKLLVNSNMASSMMYKRRFSEIINYKQIKYFLVNQNFLRSIHRNAKHNSSNERSSEANKNELDHRVSLSFDEMMKYRNAQARKSIYVEVNSCQAVNKLYRFCSQHVPIEKIFYFSPTKNKNFVLLELESIDGMKELLHQASFLDQINYIPVTSQFFTFNDNNTNIKVSDKDIPYVEYEIPQMTKVIEKLQQAKSMSKQMKILYNETKIQEFGIRLRYITCNQLERAFSGLFPNAEVRPFGSAVNGFGKFDSDLDMVYDIDLQYRMNVSHSPLNFQAKICSTNNRLQVQRNLEILNDIIAVYLPGCVNVQSILRARVPIIKFSHIFTGLDCDFTMTNKTAVCMSELLYIYGEHDERVRPLVFAVLRWAKENFLTQKVPGNWLSSFQYVMLVLFYLQTKPHPIIPTLETLMKNSDEKRIVEDNDCSFVRDVSKLSKSLNTENLSDLLYGFFAYYEKFNFEEKGISILTGKEETKPVFSAMYIQNPLQRSLNVAKNVTAAELKRMQCACREILWNLENEYEPNLKKVWGIINCFKPFETPEKSFKVQNIFQLRTNAKESLPLTGRTYVYTAGNSERTVIPNSQILNDSLHDKSKLSSNSLRRKSSKKKLV